MKSKKKIIIPEKLKHLNIRMDPSLKQYDGKVLFPEKLAKANEVLRHVTLPKLDK